MYILNTPLPLVFFSMAQIEHLYGLTVFENYLYATNSDNANMQPKTSVIRINRFNSTDYQVVTRVDKGGALHVYHQRRQPPGRVSMATPRTGKGSVGMFMCCWWSESPHVVEGAHDHH